jgi:serine/threonine protein kinase
MPMKTEDRRVCPSCGNEFSGAVEFCPVCMLHKALAEDVESDESSYERVIESKSQGLARRFHQYELIVGEDGRPIELGRGAMGVTYKALDVDLHCHVTLKVISEKFVGDETARLRFLREARAAASVRHPNVASVFHLGRSAEGYFYAMEFVEGETLQNLIKRSGPLEVKLALYIATQVAAGLAAVHKKKLVHRDIKPSNIMVSFEEEGAVTAKIIDLGLAKVVDEAGAQTTISASGAFAGTPEFASPEQIVGGEVDIRSDLYSLGVSLWQMLTGQVPFRGSAGVVMAQHQHTPVPLERLEGIPQPVVSLITALLEKDPQTRIQTPAELLKFIPTVASAIDEGITLTYQSSRQLPAGAPSGLSGKTGARLGPQKISIARLPVTGSDVFGREEDIAFLDESWANQDVNVVTIVAWAGVGKSTLINHWLRAMAAQHYRSAQLVFGWSFYRQGTSEGTSSADEFIEAALVWFGDADPRIGRAWEKGERLAKLIAHRRTLLVLDGLEPLQNPPGPQEGRVRDPSLQALLRELAAFNAGLCVITTRLPIADLAEHERSSAPRRDLEQLSSDAGARVLRALGVKGAEAELRGASEEFRGHCLALTLLGSYLTDAYDGDIRYRKEVSEHLSQDIRQGVHARNVMGSYQTWFGEGPELSVLRMLGLFDRPADEKALAVLLKPPAIPGLSESLTALSPSEWRTILSRLRRARLLAGEDPHDPRHLDAHPLVREYFGEQLRAGQADAWKECNRRLYYYYRTLAPQLPNSFREMETLFLAVICGCNAGLFREALHDVYIPRIQRGDSSFAANILGARGALLLVLSHFFENGRWGSLIETAVEGQSLAAADQLLILMQAGSYLTATRGLGASEARICYEGAEPLCRLLNRPLLLSVALTGQWHYSLHTDKLTATMQIVERIQALAREQDDAALMIEAYRALAVTVYYSGDFETAQQYATRALQIWRSGNAKSHTEAPHTPAFVCMCYLAGCKWHLGEIAACQTTIAEAISLAEELNDMNALAIALAWAASMAANERNPAEVDRFASDLIELSTRDNFVFWLAIGTAWRGWARSASGNTAEGIPLIEQGIRDYLATGALLSVQHFLGRKAEALYLADRTSEALEAVNEAEALAERIEHCDYRAELHWLRGVFLTARDADEAQIEACFRSAIRIAQQQKSISLVKRAEATQAEYRRQKASASGGPGFRLALW